MTAPDLDALARETITLGERATKGPWTITPNTHEDADPGEHFVRMGLPSEHGYWNHDSTIMGEADAALIAAYRTSAPALAHALLAAREAMREALAAMRKLVRTDCGCVGGCMACRPIEQAAEVLESALRSGAGQGEGGGG